MKIVVFSASPNQDGLTDACVNAAINGLKAANAEVEFVNLNQAQIGSCQACNNGWGTCFKEHRCQTEDGFQAVHQKACESDGLVLVSPVYWGEMSEVAKNFTDRIRRCEATLDQASRLKGKPVLAVAAAGGSGNGMITCLASIERWIDHVRARKFDLIPVNRWSRAYKVVAIRAAAEAMTRDF